MTPQDETKRILSNDCHKVMEIALTSNTWEAAELYERHIKLLEEYLTGTRVLH